MCQVIFSCILLAHMHWWLARTSLCWCKYMQIVCWNSISLTCSSWSPWLFLIQVIYLLLRLGSTCMCSISGPVKSYTNWRTFRHAYQPCNPCLETILQAAARECSGSRALMGPFPYSMRFMESVPTSSSSAGNLPCIWRHAVRCTISGTHYSRPWI